MHKTIAATNSAPKDRDRVTTTELCDLLGITRPIMAQWRSRRRWKIEPLVKGNRRLGIEAIWSLSEARHSLPAKPPVLIPEDYVDRADGKYVWIGIAARQHFPGTGKVGGQTGTIKAWTSDGCIQLPRGPEGKLWKARSFTLKYRKAGRDTPCKRLYVHEKDVDKAVAALRATQLASPGQNESERRVRTHEARLISGLGYFMFKRFIENRKECRKLLGRIIVPEIRPTVGSQVIKEVRWWLREDMIEVAKTLKSKSTEYPDMLMEWHAREKFPSLPSGPLSAFHTGCKFLPEGRPIRFKTKILRLQLDGRYEYRTVYDPDDLAMIEAENRLMIRDSRNRIVGRRTETKAVAIQDTALHAMMQGAHGKLDTIIHKNSRIHRTTREIAANGERQGKRMRGSLDKIIQANTEHAAKLDAVKDDASHLPHIRNKTDKLPDDWTLFAQQPKSADAPLGPKIQACWKPAHESKMWAIQESGVEGPLKTLYEYIRERGPKAYDLPDFNTWRVYNAKYDREVERQGKRKNHPRGGRTGRSIVRPSEI
jgi:hypothetical protein